MNAIWLSWENHRRSREMSKALDVPFRVIRGPKGFPFYPLAPFVKSLFFLATCDAKTVIVQNPSLLLAVLACALKDAKGFRVVQDLHSYFSLHIHQGVGLRGKVYRALSRYCIRRANVTVVTNPELKKVIDDLGGHGLVLQDAIPTFAAAGASSSAPGGERRIVYVCTYSEDEPVEEVLAAARLVEREARIFLTGRIPKTMAGRNLGPNVVLTDFLPETEYLALLNNADGVMALTTRDHTLLCGAYEGLAFRKPLILSDKAALKNYFGENTIYVQNDAPSIADGIRRLLSAKPFFDRHVEALVATLNREWEARFNALKAAVS